jgi:fructokinase
VADRGVVVVAGEALVDLVPAGRDGLFEAAPGGSPANVAVGLARLGVPTRLAARLADDLMGRRLREHLTRNGVDLTAAPRATEPTSLAIVAVGPDGGADYDFRVDGTADWQWRDEETRGLLDGPVVALHSGSLALIMQPGADVLGRLVERAGGSVTVSYDPNLRPLLMGAPEQVKERVEHLVSVADVVKVSSEDLDWLLPGMAPESVAERWLASGPPVPHAPERTARTNRPQALGVRSGPSLVVVTLGPDGVLAVAAGTGIVRRPGRRVKVVDTVGAGDAFTSALLAGLGKRDLLGVDRREALRAIDTATLGAVLDEAVLASALTCTRPGADPPTAERLLSGDR